MLRICEALAVLSWYLSGSVSVRLPWRALECNHLFQVHARIASYLNAHASTQRDSRRARKELERNRRTTLLLTGIAVLFAVSWLPLG